MNPFKLLIAPITDLVGGWLERRHQRKTQEQAINAAITQKKLEYVEQGRIAEVEWNKASIEKAGWRPGFLTILLSMPLALVFFPPLVPWIREGFAVLDETPIWYRSAIGVMVASAFGYKKFADWQMSKHYTLPDPMDKISKLDN